MAARIGGSPASTLELEPTPKYIFVPSLSNKMARVQWPLSKPFMLTTSSPGPAVICFASYLYRFTEVVSAT